MNNDRFFNAYVEILTSTLHDALNKNIVFQAQAKISGEDAESQKQRINGLEEALEEYKNIQKSFEEKNHELLDKNAELGRLKSDFEHVKAETTHLQTFKNELIVARQETQNKTKELEALNSIKEKEKKELRDHYENKIKELNQKIEYLQMTPAQRRKYDAKNSVVSTIVKPIITKQEIDDSKDGGTF